MNIFAKSLLFVTVAAVISGCTYQHRDPKEIKSEIVDAINSHNVDIPADVAAEMKVNNPLANNSVYAPTKRFKIQASNVEAKEFFASLITDSSYSIIVHPEVSGIITLDLQNVTIGDVLNAVANIYGFDIQQKGKIFYVYPSGVRTETFQVDYLQVKRTGKSSLNITTGGVSSEDSDSDSSSNNSNSSSSDSSSDDSNSFDGDSGTSVSTTTEHDFWTSLEKALTNFISSGDKTLNKSVIVNPESGLVVVSATPSELKAIKVFLDNATKRLNRQVLIEAKILEVSLSEGFQHGINWSMLGQFHANASNKFTISNNSEGNIFNGGNSITNSLGNLIGINWSSGDLNLAVSLLQTQGDVSVLSTPRVTTSNNQKAVIKVGTDAYYVTEVSSTTVSSSSTTQSSPEVEFTPFFSGVSLDVTPQIDNDGQVVMHIHPSVIEVEEQKRVMKIGDSVIDIPMAKSSIRETDTVVKAASGDVIIIGGLMRDKKVNQDSKVPLLGDIPYLGELFKNSVESTEKLELVIMLRPVVIEDDTWKSELRRSNQLLEKWYPSQTESK